MPWCDTCDRLVDDDELHGDACPTCGTGLVEPARHPVSWRLRLLVAATVVYLGWRCVQGVQWLTHHA
ncbi:MAG TPA: hypothetical protein VKT18_06775 [Acidimicrobiales bacterium]|nr:hypothetical protein [Acidimicrobiales bacterium]